MRSESNRCRVSAVNASSAQVIAIIALAMRVLSLSSRDGHVPRCVPSQQLLCRILKLSTSGTLKLLYIYNTRYQNHGLHTLLSLRETENITSNRNRNSKHIILWGCDAASSRRAPPRSFTPYAGKLQVALPHISRKLLKQS